MPPTEIIATFNYISRVTNIVINNILHRNVRKKKEEDDLHHNLLLATLNLEDVFLNGRRK